MSETYFLLLVSLARAYGETCVSIGRTVRLTDNSYVNSETCLPTIIGTTTKVTNDYSFLALTAYRKLTRPERASVGVSEIGMASYSLTLHLEFFLSSLFVK